jgi:ABC-type branched-subunit amino acid transport system ATPase component
MISPSRERHEQMTTPAAPILECKNVSFRIGGLQILDDISFSIAPGEIVGIVGPNGSGKSTFLNVVSGFVKPSNAEISFRDRDITNQPAWRRARGGIGRSFQRVRVVETATARQNVEAGLIELGTRNRNVDQVLVALERVRVAEFASWPLRYLSYGTRRKVELARVIVAEPSLLLVDEPTAGISRAHIVAIERVLKEEAERGCAVVIVDHDLDFIRRVTPRVVVFDYGREIFAGTPEEAFSEPHVVEAYLGKQ